MMFHAFLVTLVFSVLLSPAPLASALDLPRTSGTIAGRTGQSSLQLLKWYLLYEALLPPRTWRASDGNMRPQQELDEITQQHRAFVSTAGREGKRAELHKAQLPHINHPNEDLSGILLREATLFGANLAHAKLIKADLSGAYLSRAELAGADLAYVDLTGADVNSANLRGANLAQARLYGTNLSRALLDEADLSSVPI